MADGRGAYVLDDTKCSALRKRKYPNASTRSPTPFSLRRRRREMFWREREKGISNVRQPRPRTTREIPALAEAANSANEPVVVVGCG